MTYKTYGPYEKIAFVAEPLVAGLVEACSHPSIAEDLAPQRVLSVLMWTLCTAILHAEPGCSPEEIAHELRRQAESYETPLQLPPGMTTEGFVDWLNKLGPRPDNDEK